MAVQKRTEPKTPKKVFCDKCGQEIKGFQPCVDRKRHVCDNCCEKCYNAGGGTCKAYERRKAWIEHERQKFITFMGSVGFRRSEAVKMADFALLDFGNYQEAFEYYSRNEKFLSG